VTYNLRNGFKVTTRKVADGTEFQTVNPQGETISTVTLGYLSARDLVLDLRRKAA
jgi:hypothetical protein